MRGGEIAVGAGGLVEGELRGGEQRGAWHDVWCTMTPQQQCITPQRHGGETLEDVDPGSTQHPLSTLPKHLVQPHTHGRA